MHFPLSLQLALRFYRSKRKAALASFMSFAATAGIAVGVLALIVGLSAMNGFERELNARVLAVIPSAQIKAQAPYFQDAAGFAARLSAQPGIVSALPALELEAIFSNGRDFVPGLLYGIEPDKQLSVTALRPFLSAPLTALHSQATANPSSALNVILGSTIAKRLQVQAGDSCYLYVSTAGAAESADAQNFKADLFKSPQMLHLNIVGTLSIGGQLDNALGFTDLKAVLQALQLPGANQIQLKIDDLLAAPQIAYRAAAAALPEACYVDSWLSTQGKLYHDIQMIRGLMYLAMLLVMAVASFNIVSTLVMAVSEKKREIAILLTMGAPRALIVQTFCLLGLCLGLKGTLVGAVLGTAAALGLTPLTCCLEQSFNFKFLNADIYFIEFIPSSLEPVDVLLVTCCALCLSLLAALYPALRAARLQPAAELNS